VADQLGTAMANDHLLLVSHHFDGFCDIAVG
jgi:hypothetical protein